MEGVLNEDKITLDLDPRHGHEKWRLLPEDYDVPGLESFRWDPFHGGVGLVRRHTGNKLQACGLLRNKKKPPARNFFPTGDLVLLQRCCADDMSH